MSNTTGYTSLHGYYGLVPKNSDGSLPEYYSFINKKDTFYGYIGQFRAFIPPGTVLMALYIIETGKQKAVARHKFPPAGEPTDDSSIDNEFTLAELIDHDCWATENALDSLYIAKDGFTPRLGVDKAGWLYAKVGGGEYSQIYDTHLTVRVESAVYNEWLTTYIKDEAGWNRYIEDITTYDPDGGVTGTVEWTAASKSSWLTITSGASGTNEGTIDCAFEANTGSSERTGTIRVTSPKKTIDVTVTQFNTEVAPTPAPEEILPAKKVVNALASRLSSVSQAKKSITQMITDLVDVQGAVTSLTSNALISGNPVAKTIDYFMRNKVAGIFGSYGITSQMTKLTDMKNAMEKEMNFCKTAISMYNQIDMGAVTLEVGELSDIPGFDFETFPDGFPMPAGDTSKYKPDNDDPMSKYMLKLSSDLRMMNRPDDSTNPTKSAIGDMICIDGIVYVRTADGYYPVGLQEPADVCENYPLSHVSTKDPYGPTCEIDKEGV